MHLKFRSPDLPFCPLCAIGSLRVILLGVPSHDKLVAEHGGPNGQPFLLYKRQHYGIQTCTMSSSNRIKSSLRGPRRIRYAQGQRQGVASYARSTCRASVFILVQYTIPITRILAPQQDLASFIRRTEMLTTATLITAPPATRSGQSSLAINGHTFLEQGFHAAKA